MSAAQIKGIVHGAGHVCPGPFPPPPASWNILLCDMFGRSVCSVLLAEGHLQTPRRALQTPAASLRLRESLARMEPGSLPHSSEPFGVQLPCVPVTVLPASSMALLLSRQLGAASASLLGEGEREVPHLYPETETTFPRLPASGKGMMDGHALWSPDRASSGRLSSWTLSRAHRSRRGQGPC